MRKGFTLAEMLIALGIIGVIAAITLPALFTNIKSTRYKTNFKKTVSTLSQAASMSMQNYGVDYGIARYACVCGTDKQCLQLKPDKNPGFCAIFNATLKGIGTHGKIGNSRPRYNIKRSYTITDNYGTDLSLILSDGTLVLYSVAMKTGSDACTLTTGEKLTQNWIDSHPQCKGLIDANGVGLPNQEVKCSDTETTTDVEHPCVVKKGSDMSDIYPIVFHDSVVEPASNAAMYVFKN